MRSGIFLLLIATALVLGLPSLDPNAAAQAQPFETMVADLCGPRPSLEAACDCDRKTRSRQTCRWVDGSKEPKRAFDRIELALFAPGDAWQITPYWAQRSAESRLGLKRVLEDVWFFLKLALLGFAVIWVIVKREMLLGWYYGLRPHPARSLVEDRLNGGGSIDGALFSEIMRPVPGGEIEQRVRAEQARQLAQMARAAAEARLRDLELVKNRALRDAEYLRAQQELYSAVEGHELAMARLDAAQKWRARNAERSDA